MTRSWHKLVHLAQLSRLSLLLTAVSNSWVVIFLARSGLDAAPVESQIAHVPLPAALLMGAGAAAGLHTYGTALNDVMDARHDRLFSPERPIPAGRVGATGTMVLAVVCLLGAIGATVGMGSGSVFLCLAAAAAILFYDTTGKFLPVTGIVTLGLIRALNMFIPSPTLGFIFPVWLTMTHVMICSALAHHLGGKRPRMNPGSWWWLCAAGAFWTLAMVGWMAWRDPPWGGLMFDRPINWSAPVLAVIAFIGVASVQLGRHARATRSHRAVGADFMQTALLWLILYDAAWMFACRLYWPCAAHLLLFAIAYGWMRVLSALMHAAALAGAPAYRAAPPEPSRQHLPRP